MPHVIHIYEGFTTGTPFGRDDGYPQTKCDLYDSLTDAIAGLDEHGGELFRVGPEALVPAGEIELIRTAVAQWETRRVRAEKLAEIERIELGRAMGLKEIERIREELGE